MNRKSYSQLKKEKRIQWSRNANAAKAQKRISEAIVAQEVGTVVFDGAAFGGQHRIRSFQRGDDDYLLIEIDGKVHKPRTLRGLVRIICRRLWKIG